MLNIIYQLKTAEFKEFYRNPGILFLGDWIPDYYSILGFAFYKKTKVNRNIGVIVVGSNTSVIQSLQNKVRITRVIPSLLYSYSMDEAKLALKRGKINLYIEKKSNEYTI